MITLGNAAKTLGISKPALSKAISRGHMSAHKRPDGTFAIDPSELARWWESARHRFQPQAVPDFHGTTPSGNGETTPETPAHNGTEIRLEARAMLAEERLADLKQQLEEMRRQRDKWEAQSEKWQAQAERLSLAPPMPERRPWWDQVFSRYRAR